MKTSLVAIAATAILAAAPGAALAQAAAPAPPPPPAPLAIPAPHYVSIVLDVDVHKPAPAVWARVGKFCDIGEWLGLKCALASGKDGELAAVRALGPVGATLEVLVAKTDLSYTYAQPVRIGQPYTLYHGTLEAKAVSPTTSKLVYSLFFDNSTLADDAARERDRVQRTTRFMEALRTMKTLAEGGTLPAKAPAR